MLAIDSLMHNTFVLSNWGLTEHELTTIPPSLVRSFTKDGRGGFGSELPEPFGRLLMRGEYNADLYGPLHQLYHEGKKEGTDVWIHKNRLVSTPPSIASYLLTLYRISGIWGCQTALDLYLQEHGITTLLFAGVNADQVRPRHYFAVYAFLILVTVCARHPRGCILSRVRLHSAARLRRYDLSSRRPRERDLQRIQGACFLTISAASRE